MRPDEAASPAELAFIERVRRDRARVRTLQRRAIVTGAALIATIAGLFVTHGIPRWLGGDRATSGRPGPISTDAAPTGGTSNEATTVQFEALAQPKAPPDGEALEQRVARLEDRFGALEQRAAIVERRTQRLASAASKEPHGTQPRRDVKANPVASTKRVAAVSAVRQTAQRPDTAAQETTLGKKVRRGWETIERRVRRTPAEVREGFNKLKRLFAG